MPRHFGPPSGSSDSNGCLPLLGILAAFCALLWICANWDWIW